MPLTFEDIENACINLDVVPAMNMCADMFTMYLDIRIRLFIGGIIHSLYLPVTSMFCSYTGETGEYSYK